MDLAAGGEGPRCDLRQQQLRDAEPEHRDLDDRLSKSAFDRYGPITRMGADAWQGAITYNSAQGQMTINLSATRVGDCNNPS